ncbi:MAG: potassium transporter Trk [Leptospiraceae bacterium]|nr:potassium transporter Trk [Leptospiraceae bacterium]MCP5512737.1 potassium transporter Trk [Leptospiraceae bacterium]
MRLFLTGLGKFLGFIFGPLINYIKSKSVARGICISFGASILFGSLPLYISEFGNLSLIDSLYLSASAFCVTGLSPVPISELSRITQIILILYVQMGGLGIIVVTVLIGMLVITGLSRNTQLQSFITEVLDANIQKADKKLKEKKNETDRIVRVIISIFNITITLELIGTIALFFFLPHKETATFQEKLFDSLFTCISAFNNAGFSVYDDLGFTMYHTPSMIVISSLIILGGIGYPVIIFIEKFVLKIFIRIFNHLEVWGETYLMMKAIKGKDPNALDYFFTQMSGWTQNRIEDYNSNLTGESNRVQTNIILKGSLILVFGGAISILLLEYNNPLSIGSLSFSDKVLNSFFISVSSRTAGFSTISLNDISDPTIVLITLLMFVGGGPQGTAGGIKITTFVILVKYLANVISSKSLVEIFGNTISKRSVAMSIRLYFLATSALALVIFILTIFHNDKNKIPEIVFEVISAFSTVGFSLGITNTISAYEKIIYVLLMYVGRIGIFTVLIALTGNPVTSQVGQDDGLKIQVG